MKRKIIAVYDVLLYTIFCILLIAIAAILLFIFVTKGTGDWLYEHWYLVLIFAITIILPIGGAMLLSYCLIRNNSIHFHYFSFTIGGKKVFNNIDSKRNQDILISEIKDIDIVALTEEEKQIKGFNKYWFNKYFRINLEHGNPIYVYVGNYSKTQTKNIIKIIEENKLSVSIINYYKDKAEILSLDFDKQYAKLSCLGDALTDDIANEWFDEEVIALENYYLHGQINKDIVDLYREINNGFIDVSNGGVKYSPYIWTLEGLKNHPFWEHQRKLAKQLFNELDKIKL